MVRVMLAGLLVSCALMGAPVGGALPETCPPTCDRIPATAWPAPASLPLAAVRQWPPLDLRALPVLRPRFYTEELCFIPLRPDDPRAYSVAAEAHVPGPPGQWQLRARILHWRGETWRGGQLVTDAFNQAKASLSTCQVVAPQFSPSLTTDRPDRLTAVITGPQIVHQYLVAHPQSSSITELVFWAAGPAAPWIAPPDSAVLEAMAAALCGAYLSSCG